MTNKVTVAKINIRENTSAQTNARAECARLWNRLVKLHKYIRRRRWGWPSKYNLQAHFKGRFALHSQTIQALIDKFAANIDSTREKRKNGDKKARYPWRDQKRFQIVPFKGQCIKQKGNTLTLPMGRGRKPIRIRIPGNLPMGKIVAAEIGFRELRLTIKQEVCAVESAGDNIIAGDPGIIHQLVITDGEDSLGIVGRGLRSLIQGKNKQLAIYTRLLSKTKKGSRRNRKIRVAKARMLEQFENRKRNLLHQSSKKVIDYCVEREAGTLVVGDIADIARNKRKTKKGSRRSNQENSNNPLAILYQYLEYKGALNGVELVKINEAYTSQTCPACGHRHKPAGRTYKCKNKNCDFVGVRDEVGSINILNKYINDGRIVTGTMLPSGNVKYLRPVKLASRNGVDRLAGGKLLNNTPDFVAAPSGVECKSSLQLDLVA